MNVFAKFDEIPSSILEVIKETKRYGHTFVRSVGRSFVRTDNMKTVYPPTNTVITVLISNMHVYAGKYHMSLIMKKLAFCICENKDADQLHGNREADQHLCFRYTDSTIPLLPIYKISSL